MCLAIPQKSFTLKMKWPPSRWGMPSQDLAGSAAGWAQLGDYVIVHAGFALHKWTGRSQGIPAPLQELAALVDEEPVN